MKKNIFISNLKSIKIILFIFLSFFFVSSTYATNTVFYQPDISIISWTANIWTANNDDLIWDDETSRTQFCIEFWWTYISHTSTIDIWWSAIYISSQWDHSSNTSVLDTLTCDIPTWDSNLYIPWWSIWTWTTISFMYQDNYWVYHIDENFLLELILRITLVWIALPFFFYTTRKVRKMWRKTITWHN